MNAYPLFTFIEKANKLRSFIKRFDPTLPTDALYERDLIDNCGYAAIDAKNKIKYQGHKPSILEIQETVSALANVGEGTLKNVLRELLAVQELAI